VTRLLTDSLYGYGLRPVRNVHAYGLADAAISAKARLYDNTGADSSTIRGFAVRQAAAVALRLGGADAPAANEVFAPIAGDVGGGVTIQSFTDLFFGRRIATSLNISYAQAAAEQFSMRLPDAGAPAVGGVAFPLLRADRGVRLSRTPGARLDATVTPRLAVTRSIWLGASWSYSQQGADAWSIADVPAGGTAKASDASTWAAGTDWVEHRLGFGGTYSTAAAYYAGQARYNFDVSYEYLQTTAGRGWRVAKITRDVVTLRWYPRAWGR
jgi:hypothetical protein